MARGGYSELSEFNYKGWNKNSSLFGLPQSQPKKFPIPTMNFDYIMMIVTS